MGLLNRFRRRRPPAEVLAVLEPDERLVAWAEAAGGAGHLLATTRGLRLPGRDRLGWHEIHKATWSGTELTVQPGEVRTEAGTDDDAPVDVVADAEPVRFRLPDPGTLPHEVRVRVTRSVAYTSHHDLPNGGVRVLARKVPGFDGLSWALRYDPGTAPGPDDRELIAALLAEAWAAFAQPD